jgi:hypothetical protein
LHSTESAETTPALQQAPDAHALHLPVEHPKVPQSVQVADFPSLEQMAPAAHWLVAAQSMQKAPWHLRFSVLAPHSVLEQRYSNRTHVPGSAGSVS